MKTLTYFLCITILFSCMACTGTTEPSNPETEDLNPKNPTTNTETIKKTSNNPTVEEIKQILIGDWIEDSVAFKETYNMPPPPAKNTLVRYQEDGFVYIPGVLLTEENWDKWEVANDTTLHIIKRQGHGVRVFIIDSISQDVIKYRLQLPPHERKIRLMRIK